MTPAFNPGLVVMVMMMVVIAAQHAARRREEDEMTGYSSDDLNRDWEFKIVRSGGAAFRKPERLQLVLAEEARAGWELLEKLDDSRLRLKRPTSRRQLDGKLDFDPYRTYVGAFEGARVAIAVVVAMLIAFVGLFFTVFLVRSVPAPVATPAIEVLPAPPPAPKAVEPPPPPEEPQALLPRRPLSVVVP